MKFPPPKKTPHGDVEVAPLPLLPPSGVEAVGGLPEPDPSPCDPSVGEA